MNRKCTANDGNQPAPQTIYRPAINEFFCKQKGLNRLKLLIVSQYFWPETFIINDLARTLRDQGHEVTVATGKPNYPDGKIFDGYRAWGIQREIYDSNIDVIRVPLRPRGANSALDLLLNYTSFVCSGLALFPYLLRRRLFDAILVFAGSPNVSLPALPLKWVKRAHLVLWVQDLWPDSLAATGYVRNVLILRAIGWLVRLTYWGADTVLVQSPAFCGPVERYAERGKVFHYPNSIRVPDGTDSGRAPLPRSLIDTLTSQFCVVFAGNIGSAQAVETIVEAASCLKDLTNVRMVLVGSGSKSDWVGRAICERRLDNLMLAGRLPGSSMAELFSHASCLLVTLKSNEIFSYTIPSKVQTYLAAGKPIIAALNGEGARIVREAGAGQTCAAEDPAGLASCVRALYAMSAEQRQKLGDSGRRYFLEHFEMRGQTERLVQIINGRIRER